MIPIQHYKGPLPHFIKNVPFCSCSPLKNKEKEDVKLKGKIKPSRSRGKPISALWDTMPSKLPLTTSSGEEIYSFDITGITPSVFVTLTTPNSIPSARDDLRKNIHK